MTIVRAALVQAAWTGDKESMIKQHEVLYNTAAVIDADGTYLGKYRKHHIPNLPGFWEKFYFRPGNLGYLLRRPAGPAGRRRGRPGQGRPDHPGPRSQPD